MSGILGLALRSAATLSSSPLQFSHHSKWDCALCLQRLCIIAASASTHLDVSPDGKLAWLSWKVLLCASSWFHSELVQHQMRLLSCTDNIHSVVKMLGVSHSSTSRDASRSARVAVRFLHHGAVEELQKYIWRETIFDTRPARQHQRSLPRAGRKGTCPHQRHQSRKRQRLGREWRQQAETANNSRRHGKKHTGRISVLNGWRCPKTVRATQQSHTCSCSST